jgi:hypothetical protein
MNLTEATWIIQAASVNSSGFLFFHRDDNSACSRQANLVAFASRGGILGVLVPAQHQRLDRQQQCLNPQQQRVHEPGGVDDMQREALERADFP